MLTSSENDEPKELKYISIKKEIKSDCAGC
jgi:hypothetical protein